LVPHILYVGQKEAYSLFRAAFRKNIFNWIIEELGLMLSDLEFSQKAEIGQNETWICPLTDSLRINSFLKINRYSGHSFRPDWRSLERLGSYDRIRDYMASERIKRVALVEDFIGSSLQALDAVKNVCTNLPEIHFLLCPLVICETGDNAFKELATRTSNLRYDPVLVLHNRMKLMCSTSADEPELFGRIRALHPRIANLIGCAEVDIDGFRNCGTLYAMQSNIPDNSHRMLWGKSNEWEPLFPRIHRT
jgi:hypothetical protein